MKKRGIGREMADLPFEFLHAALHMESRPARVAFLPLAFAIYLGLFFTVGFAGMCIDIFFGDHG